MAAEMYVGTGVKVIDILPDTATHRNRRLIRSPDSGREYTVSQRRSTGAMECSCRGWTTHRKCKHLPPEPAVRGHWMCDRCQGIHYPQFQLADPRLREPSLGLCCWCGRTKTTLSPPPAVDSPCLDVHLEDVMT